MGEGPAPALVVLPTEDPFNVESSVRRVAARAGARLEVLNGIGHWWPYEAPERGAAVLRDFGGSL